MRPPVHPSINLDSHDHLIVSTGGERVELPETVTSPLQKIERFRPFYMEQAWRRKRGAGEIVSPLIQDCRRPTASTSSGPPRRTVKFLHRLPVICPGGCLG